MENRVFAIISLLMLTISGCKENFVSSTHSLDSSNVNNQKHITAKRIFDLEYEPDGFQEETIALQEFPDLTFKRSNSRVELVIEGRTALEGKIGAKGIYTADVNDDGYLDLAFYQDRKSGSSNIGYLVKIYDYHYDKFLFNDDNSKNSILDLDDDGVLLIEELENSGNGLKELNRVGKFLRGSEISFEWFSLDYKLKSIYFEPSIYKDGDCYAYLNKKTSIGLRLVGIGDESLDKAIPTERINVNSDDRSFSCEIKNSSIASLFYIEYTFLITGPVELNASIGNLTTNLTIIVINE